MNNMDIWFHDMVEKGLACTSRTWIERAIRQRHPKMKLNLAHSMLLIYDELDKALLRRESIN